MPEWIRAYWPVVSNLFRTFFSGVIPVIIHVTEQATSLSISLSSCMFMYLCVPHLVAETCYNRADTSIKAALLSGNAPTTRVLRRTFFRNRSIGLLVLIISQC